MNKQEVISLEQIMKLICTSDELDIFSMGNSYYLYTPILEVIAEKISNTEPQYFMTVNQKQVLKRNCIFRDNTAEKIYLMMKERLKNR